MHKYSKEHLLKNYEKIEQVSSLVKKLMAPNPSPFTFYGTGTFIIGREQICIIDPGPSIESHINNLLNSIDKEKISHILITHTHADHSPAANFIKKATGAKTYAYNSYPKGIIGNRFEEAHDKNFIPDVKLKDNEIIKGKDWTVKAIHTPGHTSNHLCYALEEEKILFTGDHVMGWATTVIVPPDGNMDEYILSLKKLLLYDYNIYYPTHGSPIENPKKYVRGLIAHRKMREVQILDELKKNSLCIDEMIPKFYATTDKRLWPAASMSLFATLLSLKKKKKILCENDVLEDNQKVWVYNNIKN